MAQKQLLFAATYDNLDNAWAVPTAPTGSSLLQGGGIGAIATTGCFYSGPEGCLITDIYYVARDLTFTDPAADVYIGYRIRYSSDGGVSMTTVATVWANADCPQLWNDTSNTVIDFTLDTPVKAFAFVGAGTGGLNESNQAGPYTIPANVHVTIEVAPVAAEVLINMPQPDLDSFDVLVFGHYKG